MRTRLPTCLFLLLAAPLAQAGSPTQSRNDTGLGVCYEGNVPQPGCMLAGHPGQDARYGRDAAAAFGALAKVGAGIAGFDFTKIANDGAELPASAPLGTGPGDWACTRDNVTGLIWEMKRNDNGLRDRDWTYTWYNTDPNSNGGDPGTPGGNTCGGTLGTQCDTEGYVNAVNAAALCGIGEWRMPHAEELQGLINYAATAGAAVDATYFPNTMPAIYWSGDPYAATQSTIFAHFVDFYFDGAVNMDMRANPHHARLVAAPVPTLAGEVGESSPREVTCVGHNPAIPPSTDGAFTANPDGTVSDARTGLIWDRCSLGQDHGNDCAGTAAVYNWQAALTEVQARNAANHLGHGDWRMPNVKELGTLVERSCWSPAIDQAFFPNSAKNPAHWTSTTHVAVPQAAWTISLSQGLYAGSFTKTLLHRVRLVRGGQPNDVYDADVVFAHDFEPAF